MRPVDPKSDPNRGLRLVVQSMGVVLVAGTILVFYLAFQKMQQKEMQAGDVRTDIPREWRTCGEHSLALAENETVERIEFDEEGMTRIITRLPGDEWRISWVHGCSGEVVARLRLGEMVK